MKKTILIALLMSLIFSLSSSPVTESAVPQIMLNGTTTILLPEPYVKDGELMVPLRMMAEAMGAEISWDVENQAIRGSRPNHSFAVQADSRQGQINGREVTLPCPVQIIEHQSFAPLHFLCDALGFRWNRDRSTIRINDRISSNTAPTLLVSDHPNLRFSGPPQAGQGEYLCMYLDNVEPADAVTLQTNLDNRADFFASGTGRLLLLPVACTQIPGIYYLQIEVQREGHTYLWAQEIIEVLPRTFPTQYLQVSAQTESLRSADLWALDRPFWEQGLAHSDDHPLWTGTFIQPAIGTISTEFGSVRIVNQGAPSRHSGLDIAVEEGTPVLASQAGVVSLAMPLNVTGNTVFIDHGCQLFSMYYHLSRIYVQAGQAVKAGDLIGEVGSTGFSTGPHLHWAMQLNGIYMNPALFINPETAPLATQYQQATSAAGKN